MLKKFSVSKTFKGFQDKITLDIGTPSGYSFNSEVIEWLRNEGHYIWHQQ